MLNDVHSEHFFCDLQLLITLTNCIAGLRDRKILKKIVERSSGNIADGQRA